jgi:hypothetical protein
MFQKNIVKNKAMKKYEKWFEFAEKTRNENNAEKDFEAYKGDEIFCEMMRRLRKDTLSDEDFYYIEDQKEAWEESERLERGFYEDGKKQGRKEGRKEGEIEGIKKGEKDKAIQTARIMKQNREPVEKISMYTGLSIDEIQDL